MIRGNGHSPGRLRRASVRVQRAVRVWIARVQRRAPAGWRKPAQRAVELESVRRRLELLLTALYERPIAIEAVETAARGRFQALFDRLRGRDDTHATALAECDEHCVRLPARTLIGGGPSVARTTGDEGGSDRARDGAIAHLRLLAIAQGARVVRGTSMHARETTSALERDLYLLRESEAVDLALAATVHNSIDTLAQARASALALRPPLDALPPATRAVEALVQAVLADDVHGDQARDRGAAANADGRAPNTPARPPTAVESLEWARLTAARIQEAHPDDVAHYRGVRPVAHWGTVRAMPRDGRAEAKVAEEAGRREAEGARTEDGANDGEPKPTPENAAQESDQTKQDSARPITEQPELDREPTTPSESGTTVDVPPEPEPTGEAGPDAIRPDARGKAADAKGIPYPEWDHSRGAYDPRGATVVASVADDANAAWADAVLLEHATLVRRVREQFERLRARRLRLRQQRDGDELDLDACVRALVEQHAGQPPDDRLYATSRPLRSPMAIALLVDCSASTNTLVANDRQIIDIEKQAVLIAGEGLDALGDRWTALTFSSEGAHDVRLTALKTFGERAGSLRRRIGTVHPHGKTRLGAAVRHATSLLVREPAGHRLLLLLSDGRPNDMDRYQGTYAIEDSRRAVLETRDAGVIPFCLTVDSEESEYLSHIFGASGYTILRRPEQLPSTLVSVVREILGRTSS